MRQTFVKVDPSDNSIVNYPLSPGQVKNGLFRNVSFAGGIIDDATINAGNVYRVYPIEIDYDAIDADTQYPLYDTYPTYNSTNQTWELQYTVYDKSAEMLQVDFEVAKANAPTLLLEIRDRRTTETTVLPVLFEDGNTYNYECDGPESAMQHFNRFMAVDGGYETLPPYWRNADDINVVATKNDFLALSKKFKAYIEGIYAYRHHLVDNVLPTLTTKQEVDQMVAGYETYVPAGI